MSLLACAACVTINVYFPSAEVEDAAEQIIQDVMGTDGQQDSSLNDLTHNIPEAQKRRNWLNLLNPVNWLIESAHAESIDIQLSSPAIREITNRMKERYSLSIKKYLISGVIGFNNKGFIDAVNPDSLGLKERQQVRKLVADENRDRVALYRELAVANKHPEWEEKIRQVFIKKWINEAQTGWFYQSPEGQWIQK